MLTANVTAVKQGAKRTITPGARLWLAVDRKFFGPGVVRLLKLIEKTGAIKKACDEMGMSYTKARKMVAVMEDELDCAIVISQQGGQHGSTSVLTDVGKELLERYEVFEAECKAMIKEAFDKNFNGFVRQLDNNYANGQER